MQKVFTHAQEIFTCILRVISEGLLSRNFPHRIGTPQFHIMQGIFVYVIEIIIWIALSRHLWGQMYKPMTIPKACLYNEGNQPKQCNRQR